MDGWLATFCSMIALVMGAACSRAFWWPVPGTGVAIYFWLLMVALGAITGWIVKNHWGTGSYGYRYL